MHEHWAINTFESANQSSQQDRSAVSCFAQLAEHALCKRMFASSIPAGAFLISGQRPLRKFWKKKVQLDVENVVSSNAYFENGAVSRLAMKGQARCELSHLQSATNSWRQARKKHWIACQLRACKRMVDCCRHSELWQMWFCGIGGMAQRQRT